MRLGLPALVFVLLMAGWAIIRVGSTRRAGEETERPSRGLRELSGQAEREREAARAEARAERSRRERAEADAKRERDRASLLLLEAERARRELAEGVGVEDPGR
jgi:hypothetical protein